ncbi:MAG: hypothetical protein V3U82_07560 [Robiginitomaculum sp.]
MKFLRKISTWKTYFVLLALYVFFVVFIMKGMSAIGPENLGPLDLLFSYSPEQVYSHFDSYGEAGRASYQRAAIFSDGPYMLVYTAGFMVLIMILAKKLWPARGKMHRLALVPVFPLLFDIGENSAIVAMLRAYPERMDGAAQIASLFSSLKWSSVGLTSALIAGLAITLLIRKFKP